MNSILLDACALSFTRDKKKVINEVSLKLHKGDFHVVLGPNGEGKSTLLKLLAGELETNVGDIRFDGKKLNRFSLKELSKKRAVLPQLNQFLFPMSVYEVCALGRTPYMGSTLNLEDKKIIEESLIAVDMWSYADQEYSKISGGEQQRVQIARILCQQTDLLLLDEPFTALDIKHQIELMELLVGLTCKGKTILCIMHDINFALRYASHLSFLKDGRLAFQGVPEDIKNAEVIESVYDVKAELLFDKELHPQIYMRDNE